jgi:hypothetical protein
LGAGPALVWNGSEYGIAWNAAGVRFARLDESGASLGAAILVSDAAESLADAVPSLAWTGQEWGVAWQSSDDGAIHFARLDAAGARIGEEIPISSHAAVRPVLVAAGANYGLAWLRDGPREIHFSRLSAAGEKLGPELLVPTTAVPAEIALAWTGSDFGLAWEGAGAVGDAPPAAIYFARLDSDGAVLGSEVLVTAESDEAYAPSLTSAGVGYGLAWSELSYGAFFEVPPRIQARP